MSKVLLLKIWYLTAFGLTGLFCGVAACVGLYMSVQPREATEATAYKSLSSSGSCVYYFTYEAGGKQYRSEPENYHRGRTGCPLTNGEVETIYYKESNPLDFTRSSSTFGLIVSIAFGLIACTFPLAVRKKWSELDKKVRN